MWHLNIHRSLPKERVSLRPAWGAPGGSSGRAVAEGCGGLSPSPGICHREVQLRTKTAPYTFKPTFSRGPTMAGATSIGDLWRTERGPINRSRGEHLAITISTFLFPSSLPALPPLPPPQSWRIWTEDREAVCLQGRPHPQPLHCGSRLPPGAARGQRRTRQRLALRSGLELMMAHVLPSSAICSKGH